MTNPRDASGLDAGAIALPARQHRSQRTQSLILQAAHELMCEGGLEAATIPAIAQRAGISVGAVYRRFPDKDAMLRAVAERFIARAAQSNARALDPSRWRDVRPDVVAGIFVRAMAKGFRVHAPFIKALEAFARSHPDPEFRARIEAFNLAGIRQVSEFMLARRGQIHHPDPPAGVRFASIAIAATLRMIAFSEGKVARMLDLSEDEIDREMVRIFVRHLGIEERPDSERLALELGEKFKREIIEEMRAAGELPNPAERGAVRKAGTSGRAKPAPAVRRGAAPRPRRRKSERVRKPGR